MNEEGWGWSKGCLWSGRSEQEAFMTVLNLNDTATMGEWARSFANNNLNQIKAAVENACAGVAQTKEWECHPQIKTFLHNWSFLKLHINFLRWRSRIIFGGMGTRKGVFNMHCTQKKKRREERCWWWTEHRNRGGAEQQQPRKQREEWWAWEWMKLKCWWVTLFIDKRQTQTEWEFISFSMHW